LIPTYLPTYIHTYIHTLTQKHNHVYVDLRHVTSRTCEFAPNHVPNLTRSPGRAANEGGEDMDSGDDEEDEHLARLLTERGKQVKTSRGSP